MSNLCPDTTYSANVCQYRVDCSSGEGEDVRQIICKIGIPRQIAKSTMIERLFSALVVITVLEFEMRYSLRLMQRAATGTATDCPIENRVAVTKHKWMVDKKGLDQTYRYHTKQEPHSQRFR